MTVSLWNAFSRVPDKGTRRRIHNVPSKFTSRQVRFLFGGYARLHNVYYTEIKNIHFSHVDFSFVRALISVSAVRLNHNTSTIVGRTKCGCIGRTPFFRRDEIYKTLSCAINSSNLAQHKVIAACNSINYEKRVKGLRIRSRRRSKTMYECIRALKHLVERSRVILATHATAT